jgi:hypothetical protein
MIEKDKFSGKILESIISLAVFAGLVWYFIGGGVQGGLARDFEKQYIVAKERGSPSDVCSRAGIVAEAYLQAQDQSQYSKWKAIELQDCSNSDTLRN